MEETDRNFILATWLKSYRVITPDDIINPVISRIPGRVYFAGHEPLIKSLLLRAKTLVACDRDDPAFIAGYITFEPGKIHYIYVKGTMRMQGIAKLLFTATGQPPQETVEYSHHTPAVYWMKDKLSNIQYNPYF
jgi:hypothetical protein